MFLGEIINEYRKKNNLTMEKFAQLSGLSKGYVSMLEKNKHPQNARKLAPSIETFKKVASVMNIETEDLIRMTDKGQPITIGSALPPQFYKIETPIDKETFMVAENMYNNPELNNLMRSCAELDDEDLSRIMFLLKQYRQLPKQKKADVEQILKIFLGNEENSL